MLCFKLNINVPQSDTIGVFRITEDGVLEVNGPITGQPLINSKWQIISKQYMDKETAKEYFDNRQ
ncbi:hypothetical protein BW731_03015 [Vagococcus martis]|uniref:Uncharacterized protein n=1 Tax=Vagococcus martis TaxID=1768210 RepID=A0A1V4DFK9_9ENTE|nr:hypothetical protein BW731_03015 [Vagococcus martis]